MECFITLMAQNFHFNGSSPVNGLRNKTQSSANLNQLFIKYALNTLVRFHLITLRNTKKSLRMHLLGLFELKTYEIAQPGLNFDICV